MIYKPKTFILEKDADRNLFTLLSMIVFSICFIGSDRAFNTGLLTTAFELTFIITYAIYAKKIAILRHLTKNKILLLISTAWLLIFHLSLFQLYVQQKEENQLIIATLKYFFTITHLTFIIFVSNYLSQSSIDSKIALYPIPIAGIIIAAISTYTILHVIPNGEIYFTGRPFFAANIRHLGFIFSISSIISGLWILNEKTASTRTILISTITFINLTFLFWLGGRTANTVTVICLILSIISLHYKCQLKTINSALLFIIILSSGFIASILSKPVTISGILEIRDLNKLTSGRIDMWLSAINNNMDSFYLGQGPEGYLFSINNNPFLHPHNIFIQTFVEWGILGAGLFTILLTYSFIRLLSFHIKNNKADHIKSLTPLLIITSLSAQSLTSGTYYFPQPIFFLSLSFSIIIALKFRKTN